MVFHRLRTLENYGKGTWIFFEQEKFYTERGLIGLLSITTSFRSPLRLTNDIHKSATQTSRPSGCFIHLHETGLIIFTRSGHQLWNYSMASGSIHRSVFLCEIWHAVLCRSDNQQPEGGVHTKRGSSFQKSHASEQQTIYNGKHA